MQQASVSPLTTVTVSMYYFINETYTSWEVGDMDICNATGQDCVGGPSGYQATLSLSGTYELLFMVKEAFVAFQEWGTNAGLLSSNTSNPALFYPESSGYISVITTYSPTNWIGYIDSTCGACDSVSGLFTLPASGGAAGIGMWIGIGGMESSPGTYTNLLQMGVQFNVSSESSSGIHPWYEECSGPGQCNGPIHYNWRMVIQPLDALMIGVVSYNQPPNYELYVRDLTFLDSWYVNVSFTPSATNVEWIDEPLTSGGFSPIDVYNLRAMGQSQTLGGQYIAPEYRLRPYYAIATPLYMGCSSSRFWHSAVTS